MMLDITENNENFKVDEALMEQFELKPLSEFEKLMELEREAVAEAVTELLAEVFPYCQFFIRVRRILIRASQTPIRFSHRNGQSYIFLNSIIV